MMTMTMSQTKKDDSPRLSSKAAKSPRLKARRIGIVSRDYTHKYKNGFRDFSDVFSRVLALLDQKRCDTVLFSSFSIIPRSSFRPLRHMQQLRHIKSVFYEEFTGRHFSVTEGKWKKGRNPKGRYVVLHRKVGEWQKCEFEQVFGSLTGEKPGKILDFVSEEVPKRILGNCFLLLCGESNGVNFSRADMKVHDDRFYLRKAIPRSAAVILNPIHDRMVPYQMNCKRSFLSEKGRWVVSVWNKGKKNKNGRGRDGRDPAWKIFHDGQEKVVERIENHLEVEIGILDTRGSRDPVK